MSPRAAGNSDTYDFLLNGDKRLPQIQLTSVTTILRSIFGADQYVVDWATKFKDKEEMGRYRDVRREEGTLAHAYVEDWVAAEPDKKPTAKTGFDEAFLKYVAENNPTFILSESVVFSLRYGYAGTLDLGILGPGGEVIVCDTKTRNKNIYQAYTSDKLQCAAYYLAAVERGLIPEQEHPTIAVLMLKENGRFTYREYPAPVTAWLDTLSLYQSLKGVV